MANSKCSFFFLVKVTSANQGQGQERSTATTPDIAADIKLAWQHSQPVATADRSEAVTSSQRAI
jgi:hypothetical protein